MGEIVNIKNEPPREPTEIEAAAHRLLQLSLAPYVPANLKADLDLIITAAMAWDMFRRRHDGVSP